MAYAIRLTAADAIVPRHVEKFVRGILMPSGKLFVSCPFCVRLAFVEGRSVAVRCTDCGESFGIAAG